MKYKNGEFKYAGWDKFLRRWTKYGHDRVYINNDNGKNCGYVDLVKKEVCWSHPAYEVLPGADEYVAAILEMEF